MHKLSKLITIEPTNYLSIGFVWWIHSLPIKTTAALISWIGGKKDQTVATGD